MPQNMNKWYMCASTIVDLHQLISIFKKKAKQKSCRNCIFIVTLQRQKVNRLFRLVVIDLGF